MGPLLQGLSTSCILVLPYPRVVATMNGDVTAGLINVESQGASTMLIERRESRGLAI